MKKLTAIGKVLPMDVLGIFKISSEFSKASKGIKGSSG